MHSIFLRKLTILSYKEFDKEGQVAWKTELPQIGSQWTISALTILSFIFLLNLSRDLLQS